MSRHKPGKSEAGTGRRKPRMRVATRTGYSWTNWGVSGSTIRATCGPKRNEGPSPADLCQRPNESGPLEGVGLMKRCGLDLVYFDDSLLVGISTPAFFIALQRQVAGLMDDEDARPQ